MNARAFVAEFVGTFALVLIGAGTVVVTGNIVAIAFAHGLVLMVFAYAYGHISGAHVNPAVTTGLWFNKEIEGRTALAISWCSCSRASSPVLPHSVSVPH